MFETLGRLHVLVVHFPIALLLVGGALELWNRRSFAAQRAALARLCISLGAVSAIVAAVLGWIHADHARLGSSAAETLALHRWSGIATALVALAAVMLGRGTQAEGERRPWHLASVVLAMVLVAATGHFGGELVYGEGFFLEGLIGQATSRAAEAPSDPVPGSQSPAVDAQRKSQEPHAAPNSGPDFATQIRPILEASCYECHGERKQKGRLRLDRIETALKPNEDGDWIVKPGDPAASELMRRVTLPEDDDDHMPAKDESLTKEQIELLKRWIELGAPTGATASAGSPPHAAGTTTQSAAPTPPARDEIADALDELRNSGAIAQKVAQDSELLDVDFHLRGASVTDEQLAALDPLAPKLVQLNLAHTAVTDAGLEHVAKLTALEQLNLSDTALGDAGLAHLAQLAKLEVLNLYATHVTDRGLAQLAALPSLKRVYVWQTQVTDAGAAALATLRPDVTVVRAQ